jgi:hypothetical protein
MTGLRDDHPVAPCLTGDSWLDGPGVSVHLSYCKVLGEPIASTGSGI